MIRPPCVGPRQTVERVLHPNRGEGFAVYDHGASVLALDGVEPIAMRIRLGGADREGSYLHATDPEHGEVRLRILVHGERHGRAWHSVFGGGWLVWEAATKPSFIRFEADDGAVLRVPWHSVSVGTPDYAKRMARSRSRAPEMTDEEKRWRTFTAVDGSTWAFRDAPPDPPPKADETPAPDERQGSLCEAIRIRRARTEAK